ncbi:CC0125/CC1285 family lipoprotein [Candidatus Avelusimicrobium aviculae]|uniref:CC0125/CC1285 family lipoprotein n=1 Tax=Candidatus Avelusimicrobium aviculae TaxID=3416206 RepID=UPI003D0DE8B7
MKKVLFIAFSLCIVAGCATSYKAAKKPTANGYFSVQLQEGLFNVSFKGNEDTSVKVVKDYALLRSAEVCLENGYKSFSIVDSRDVSITEDFFVNGYGGSSTQPHIDLTIQCSPDNDLLYQAAQIQQNIREIYDIKE